MTDMLTNRKEQLFFDIDFFKNSKKEKSDIIPNDYRESLTQTVFFNMTKEKDKEMSPIRCEILSQGLTSLEIKNNVECIYNILSDNDKLTPPFPINNDDRDSAPYTRIPKVLKSAEMAFEANKKIVKNEVGII